MGENSAYGEARRMLDAFASVGATHFIVTWTNSAGAPRRARSLRTMLQLIGGPLPSAKNDDWLDAIHISGISHADLSRTIAALLDTSVADRLNLTVRPYGDDVRFIQLDDLAADRLLRLSPAMFLIHETSPGSFQAWLAMSGAHDREFARRVKIGTQADLNASGATRIAGSFNFKDEYAPDFPCVHICEINSGRRTTPEELDQLGVVAPPEEFAPVSPPRIFSPSFATEKWPSYSKALDGAPRNRAGNGPDRSRADYWFCFLAAAWGRGIEQTAARLLEVSAKAQLMEKESKGYALMTARNAAAAVSRRPQSSPRRGSEYKRR
ncbi:MAG TPA: hypothetical protein VMF67_15650 [Rhizomicrobium sp.]|nr:hypothetical protein [Rhizomicrobium sp.]